MERKRHAVIVKVRNEDGDLLKRDEIYSQGEYTYAHEDYREVTITMEELEGDSA